MAFDRRLDPLTVHRGNLRIESGEVRSLLATRFDPVRNVAILQAFDDRPLEPDVRYRLVVDSVRDLNGASMAEKYVATFTTGHLVGQRPSQPLAQWADVGPIFHDRCVDAGCHASERPAAGLDLSSAAGVFSTAIGRPSSLSGAGVLSSPLLALPIVDVTGDQGRPAHSYLLYKVLGDPNVSGDPMPPPTATAASSGLGAEEIATLQRWILAGAPTD